MDVSGLTITLRPRTPWEAMDLGVGMWRQWFWPLYRVWVPIVGGMWLLIAVVCAWFEEPWFAFAIIWWLKPLYDRIALTIYSEGTFGNFPTVRDVITGWRRWLGRGLIWQLTVLRFDPFRAIRTPILLLEGQSGAARGERTTNLFAGLRGHAGGLLIAASGFEQAMSIGLVAIALLFIPEEMFPVDFAFWEFLGFSVSGGWLSTVGYLIALAIIEPLYVAAGFSMYLNRRIRLEGWDIELRFRELATRLATATMSLSAAVLLIGVTADPVRADDLAPTLKPEAAAQPTIERILSDPMFGGVTTERQWMPRFPDDSPEESTEWFSRLGHWFSTLSEALLWVGLALGLGLLLYAIIQSGWRVRFDGIARKDDVSRPPRPVLVMSSSLLASARERLVAGDSRGALSLMYQGTLAGLDEGFGTEIATAATEAQVVATVSNQLSGPEVGLVDELIAAWRRIAYAGQGVSVASVETLLERCESTFGPPREGGG
ncbi:MAG: hypothetical protein AAF493_00420 [Pseudomonadota bacterium]